MILRNHFYVKTNLVFSVIQLLHISILYITHGAEALTYNKTMERMREIKGHVMKRI